MPKADRGFASMKKDDVKRIAAMGGKAAHQQGVAHQWTPKEAAAAGARGGNTTAARRAAKQRGL